MPATVNLGDLLLVFISLHYTSFNSPATIQTPSGWTEVWNARHTVSSNVIEVGVYARVSNGTEGGTTVDFVTSGTNPNANGAAQCYRITDWFGSLSGIEVGTENSGASANPDPPSLTPSWGAEDGLWFVVAGAADDDATVNTYPSLFGNGVDTTSGASANNRSSIGVARRETSLTVINPTTFTLSEAELWISQTLAVRSAEVASATSAQTLPSLSQSGSGEEALSGAGDQTLSGLQQAGEALHPPEASAAQTVPALQQAGIGEEQRVADAAQVLPGLVSTGAAEQIAAGVAAMTLPGLEQRGESFDAFEGSASQLLPSLRQSSVGSGGQVSGRTDNLQPMLLRTPGRLIN